MAKVSTGGFIVLPGGYGTFEEAFEMITWNQLRIHQLPVVILNSTSLFVVMYTAVKHDCHPTRAYEYDGLPLINSRQLLHPPPRSHPVRLEIRLHQPRKPLSRVDC
jgi:hypothetical protein